MISLWKLVCVAALMTVIDPISGQNSEDFIFPDQGSIWIRGTLNPAENLPHDKIEGIQNLNDSLKSIIILPEIFPEQGDKAPKFQLPVRENPPLNDPGYFTISAYFDHDSLFPDHILDYACGDLTYDLADGYNHSGTDIFIWPFPWKKMDEDAIEVVAAAPGILYYKQDGNFDQHCEITNDDWNGCAVLHADGSTSWYIHLKKNSLTTKSVGEIIETGEYLGVVGSSGRSLSPHLHFEIYDPDGNLMDPFKGDCNNTSSVSMWEDQLPYKERGINRISTNSSIPELENCPEIEVVHESEVFTPGDTIYLLTYFKNIFTGDQLSLNLRRPDNSIYASWTWTSNWPFYAASWLYFYAVLNNENYGNWTFEAEYDGIVYSHSFLYKETQGLHGNEASGFTFAPNPAWDFVIIEAPEPVNEIRIMSLTGVEKLILVENSDSGLSGKLNVQNLEAGVYILSIRTGNNWLNKKLVIGAESR